jgi:hypothetical protein
MTAVLAQWAAEIVPRDRAKWFSRVLGCSVRTGKRYAAHPELFPRSRAEQLLIALELEEAELEARRVARRAAREAVKCEIRAELGLDGPRLDMYADRLGLGLAGREGGESRGVLQAESAPQVEPPTGNERPS